MCAFAERAKETNEPIYTLTREVQNIIKAITPNRIERLSADGISHTNQPTKLDVLRVWKTLLTTGRTGGTTIQHSVPSFTFALVQAAMPEIIDVDIDKREIVLKPTLCESDL